MSASSRLQNRHSLLYALPAFVLAFPTLPVFVLLPTFYADTMGLGLAAVGTVFLLLRLMDVLSDPVLGWVSDRIPTKAGKRKLPMALGGLIGAPALIMLFSPPQTVGLGYLAVWGALLYLAWTAIQIPYTAWAAELETDYDRRARLNGAREAAGLLGILAVGGAMALMADDSEAEQFERLAWITVLCGLAVFFVALRFVPEGRHRDTRIRFSFPYANGLFLRVLTAWFVNGLANGLPAVTLPLFMTHILVVDAAQRSALLFVYFLFAVLAIPFWQRLSSRLNKHRVWCLSMLGACAVFLLVPLLGPGDVLAFGVVCALTGMALGSDLSLPPAIQADCADWDRLRFDQERTATLFAYWSMATKLALGAAVGFAFPVLSWVGLDADSGTTPESAKVLLVVIYAGLPIVLKLVAVFLMWDFPLDRHRHSAIKRALERRP